jgi:hypothetical protein
MKVERYSGFANGRWLSDKKFEHNDGRVTKRKWANPMTIYCGSDGIKRHGYYWKNGEVQPRLGKYLNIARGKEADDSQAKWLKANKEEASGQEV